MRTTKIEGGGPEFLRGETHLSETDSKTRAQAVRLLSIAVPNSTWWPEQGPDSPFARSYGALSDQDSPTTSPSPAGRFSAPASQGTSTERSSPPSQRRITPSPSRVEERRSTPSLIAESLAEGDRTVFEQLLAKQTPTFALPMDASGAATFLVLDQQPGTGGEASGHFKTWMGATEVRVTPSASGAAKMELLPVLVTGESANQESEIALQMALVGIAPQELFSGEAENVRSGGREAVRVVERVSGTIQQMQSSFTDLERLDVAEQVVAQMERLHEQGIAHLDLKADNLVALSRQVDQRRIGFVSIIDFGAAVPLSEKRECVEALDGYVHCQAAESTEESIRLLESATLLFLDFQNNLARGHLAYQAPEIKDFQELLPPQSVSEASSMAATVRALDPRSADVWSLGFVLLGIAGAAREEVPRLRSDEDVVLFLHQALSGLTGTPFLPREQRLTRQNLHIALDAALKTQRISLAQAQLLRLAERCLQIDPTDRLPISEVAERLGRLHAISLDE